MRPLTYTGLVTGLIALVAFGAIPALADCAITGQTSDMNIAVPGSELEGAGPEMTVTPVGTVTFRVTSGGIVAPDVVSQGGLHVVTVVNETSSPRGIVMKGIDKCCSPYTRFTKVLRPGQQVSFRWYFPADRQVKVTDLLRCVPAKLTCMLPRSGGLSTTVDFPA